MDFIELAKLKKSLEEKEQLSNEERKLLSELQQLEDSGLNLNILNESLGVSNSNVCPKCKRPY